MKIYIHENCLFYSSRLEKEEDEKVISRVLAASIKCRYEECKIRAASIGCCVRSCRNIYHYGCAILVGGELLPDNGQFYCHLHVPPLIELKKRNINFPRNFPYIIENDWATIPREMQLSIRTNFHKFSQYEIDGIISRDLASRVQIRRIFPGHWAWCNDMADENQDQYELITTRDFAKDDFICEYVGEVTIADNSNKESRYCAILFKPDDATYTCDLLIDAANKGNEARYINSVIAGITPPFVHKNASMCTVVSHNQVCC